MTNAPQGKGCTTDACPGCGVVLAPHEGEAHPYLGASPSCWNLFGKVLEREYSEPAYMVIHRVTVDAYAAQHPGVEERRSVRSVNIHLIGLQLVLERGLSPNFATKVIGKLTAANERMRWLEPPASRGAITVSDVVGATTPEEHSQIVTDWGRSVWNAWKSHHEEIIRIATSASNALS